MADKWGWKNSILHHKNTPLIYNVNSEIPNQSSNTQSWTELTSHSILDNLTL